MNLIAPLPRLIDGRSYPDLHPGELIASLPAIFGFYPQESLIFMTVGKNPRGFFFLGPTVRIDLPDYPGTGTATLPSEMLGALRTHEFLLAVMVTTRPPEELPTANVGRDPDVLWLTSEILSQGTYTALSAHDIPPGWESGRIPLLSSCPEMGKLIAGGELPALNREEALARFARDPRTLPGHSADTTADAKLAHAAAQRLGTTATELRDFHEQALAFLTDMEATHTEAEHLVANPSQLSPVLPALLQVHLRDAFIAALFQSPRAGMAVMLAAARCFGGEMRSNALALFALVAANRGMTAPALLAITIGAHEDPQHSLLQLLNKAHRVGRLSIAVTAARRGAAEVLDLPRAA